MRLRQNLSLAIAATLVLGATVLAAQPSSQPTAEALAQKLLIVDTHIDYLELHEKKFNLAKGTKTNFDFPRARKGGLKAAFMALFVSVEDDASGKAEKTLERRLDLIEEFYRRWPEWCAPALSPADVLKHAAEGKLSLPLGMENAAPLMGDLQNVRRYYDRGVRYITLCHVKNNHVCDSSTDEAPHWNGLSPFGKLLVPEMNRLGIMVDLSHTSDATFAQVIELSKAPVIASHSSCRSFMSPGLFGYQRDLSDDMLKALARNGGVAQICFGSGFLHDDYWKFHRLADVKDVAAHIDHAVKVAGIDHVGLGSDFDGTDNTQAKGLEDVSCYPNLIRELLVMGYSEDDLRKICGGNLLRVWSEVETKAKELQAAP